MTECEVDVEPDLDSKTTITDCCVKIEQHQERAFEVATEFGDCGSQEEFKQEAADEEITLSNDKPPEADKDPLSCDITNIKEEETEVEIDSNYESLIDDKISIENNIIFDRSILVSDSTVLFCKTSQDSKEDVKRHIENYDAAQTSRSDGGKLREKSSDISQTELGTLGNSDEHRITPLKVQDGTLDCDICFKQFKKKYYLMVHRAVVHSDERPYSCEQCSYKGKRKKNLISHQRIHADVKKHQCDICSKEFKNESSLKYHRIKHNDEPSYSCHKCSYKTKWRPDLQKHCTIAHTEVKKWQCDICSIEFKNKIRLLSHQAVHRDEKPYRCDKCSYKAKRKATLKKHHRVVHEKVRSHNNERLYGCEKCPYRSNTKCGLVAHQYVHLEVRKVRCDVCSKLFTCNDYLRKHRVVHNEEKPYSCEKCSYKTKWSQLLARHLQIHDKTKKVQCDICFKQFKSKLILKNHQIVHSEENPYSCDKCPYKAKWMRSIARHQLTHNKIK